MSFRSRRQDYRTCGACGSGCPGSKAQPTFSFFTLPAELRTMVYEELKATCHHLRLWIGGSYILLHVWTIPVALLRTCRLINKEAYHIFKPRIYQMMLLPPQICIETTQLFGVITTPNEFRHFMKVLHKVSGRRGTTTTLRKEKVAVPICESDLMRWTRRRTPEMLWLNRTLLEPTQGRYLITFLQQAELFFRGDYAWTLPIWRNLRDTYQPTLQPSAGLQILIRRKDANGNSTRLNGYGLILFGMFIERVRALTDHTYGFETNIRAPGPATLTYVIEGGQIVLKRVRLLYHVVLRDGYVMWRPSDLVPLEDGQI